MTVRLLLAAAAVAAGGTAAQAQYLPYGYGGYGGSYYNPYTGAISQTGATIDPFTGNPTVVTNGYNPYTGSVGQTIAQYNPYTGTTTRQDQAYNPYTNLGYNYINNYNPYLNNGLGSGYNPYLSGYNSGFGNYNTNLYRFGGGTTNAGFGRPVYAPRTFNAVGSPKAFTGRTWLQGR